MDVSVYQGLTQALQLLALPPADDRFDDLLTRLEAVALPRRAVSLAPPVRQLRPARSLPDRRAVARTLQRKAARRSLPCLSSIRAGLPE